jgi:hypothetical protein
MIKSNDPRRKDPEFQKIKNLENDIRATLEARMERRRDVRLAAIAYKNFSLFVHRKRKVTAEAVGGSSGGGGDMHSSTLSRFAFGDSIKPEHLIELAEVTPWKGGYAVEVPVVQEGRFICALYVHVGTKDME